MMSPSPRAMLMVASVTMKETIPNLPTSRPLKAPNTAPMHSPTSQTTRIAQPFPASPLSRNFSSTSPQMTPVTYITCPTEMSVEAVESTNTIPSTAMPSGAACWRMFRMFERERKLSQTTLK